MTDHYWKNPDFNLIPVLEEIPYAKFKIPISTEEYNETKQGLACGLVFEYTSKYPDEAPVVSIEDLDSLDLESEMKAKIDETIQENLGMEMVFSIVSSAQEWLNEKYDQVKIEQEQEAEQKKLEFEELERKKFEGTKVTVSRPNSRSDFSGKS
jgi:hypothetical protein